jgi:hypothetical protein
MFLGLSRSTLASHICSTDSIPWVHHSREEGSLYYDGRLVRLQVCLRFNTNIYRQQSGEIREPNRVPQLDFALHRRARRLALSQAARHRLLAAVGVCAHPWPLDFDLIDQICFDSGQPSPAPVKPEPPWHFCSLALSF